MTALDPAHDVAHDLARSAAEDLTRSAAEDLARSAAEDLARSAAEEWSALVTAAVLGTDRRPAPPARPGWESPTGTADAALDLLDRAAAVATARRAGRRPDAAPALTEAVAPDDRPTCPVPAANALARMLDGQHDVLLPEWLQRCRLAGFQVPHSLLPALLLRGRRNPAFDIEVRRIAGERAAWLADAMPELRIKRTPAVLPAGVDPFLSMGPPPDSGAVVSAIVGTFHDRTATWAAAGQIRLAVASIDPTWLSPLILELNRAPFHAVTERTRVDLLGLAQLRDEVVRSMPQPKSPDGVA
ncbi:MAG: hypothetical protein JWM34_3092 [Ilumatobacteraceae bacterium]|nr:hypothetical protein [Ilumatobacteraceae bacterium]